MHLNHVNGDNAEKKTVEIVLQPVGLPEQEKTPSERFEVRVGDLCPKCKRAGLDYNGMLVLTCPYCGEVFDNGCFT
jgi:hypothetical protein